MLNEFEQYLKLNVDAEKTRTNYLSRLRVFFSEYEEFNQENMNEFIASKVDEEIKKSTFNCYVYAFKKYAEFQRLELEFPKGKWINKGMHIYITEKEMNKEILPYFNRIFKNHIDKNIFTFKILFYTGLRPQELCNINYYDVDFDRNLFIIRQPKDKEDRLVPFPKKLKSDIKQFLTKDKGFDINYARIQNIFNMFNKMVRYKKHITSYCLRHSFAEYCLQKDVPIDKLSILMGHSSIETTLIYARPNQEQAIDSYRKLID